MLIRKTPVQIKEFLDRQMHRLEMPELWVGNEPNTYGPWGKGKFYKDFSYFFDPKNDADVVRFCHMTCWDLVQTAGNQTVPLLNQITNDRDPRILGERGAFPPTRKDVKIFNDNGIPPFSLESRHSIFTDFDIVGTTLAFPGFWPNLVKQFRDAGAPPRWEDRDKDSELYPIVFCGGQIFAQPGPIVPIVDVIVVGECEDGVSGSDGDVIGFPSLLLDVIDCKKSGDWYEKKGRLALLHRWARDHHWLFIPRFYDYNYYDPATTKKHFAGWVRKFEDIPERPKRRWILDLDTMPDVTSPIINAHDPSMGLGEIEASRSCTGKCSFCAEIYRYAPYREKSVEKLVDSFAENIRMSGSTNAFPTGFDFPCYSQRRELYYRLTSEVCSEVDTQSSRVDHFTDDPTWATMAGKAGMRQLAVGVEGNSERLRQIMSKGCTENKILDAVRYAIESNFTKVKFFMIADWEWEKSQDTDEIIELGRKINDLRKEYGSTIAVRFSWTPLLVEGWTPLQWCRAVVEDKKLVGVYERLKPLGIAFTLGRKTERNYYYFMQAFHMADPLLAECMLRVAEQHDQVYCGAVDRKWVSAMEVEMAKEGLTWDHYFRKKDTDEAFWWDIIDIDIPKQWFLDYHTKMMAMVEATDPDKVGHQAMHQELVEIGKTVAKNNKGLRLQTHLLEKGQLVGNCDTVCSACMACETGITDKSDPTKVNTTGKVDFYKDIMKPKYFKGNVIRDEPFGNLPMVFVDDVSFTKKIRLRVSISPDTRFMPNDYWVAAVRRACYMGGVKIGKRAIRIASDKHGFKPWIAGTDYIELGIQELEHKTPAQIVDALNENSPNGLTFIEGKMVSREADLATAKKLMGWFKYELDCTIDEARGRLAALQTSHTFNMKREEYRAGISTVTMNTRDWLREAWLTREGTSLQLSMLMNYGEPTPYPLVASVFRMTEPETRHTVCSLQDLFAVPPKVLDFFTPPCIDCGNAIPMTILDKLYNNDYCLKCSDAHNGVLIATADLYSEVVA